jgi:ubiquinone/menaquinone biosynthesis C-methylase UbiE
VEAKVHVTTDSGEKQTSYFDEAYRDYGLQNPTRKLDHYLDRIDARVGNGPRSLLDLGCGLGSFLERAANRHPDWTFAGSDIEEAGVSQTRQRLPEATILKGPADQALFPDDTFDIVTAWDVLEHIPDIDATASSVTSVLRPGGLFIFVVPVYDGVTGPLIRRLDKDPTHIHKWSRSEWVSWATQRFDQVQWHGLVRYLLGHTYIHVPTKRARSHTPAILVSCQAR